MIREEEQFWLGKNSWLIRIPEAIITTRARRRIRRDLIDSVNRRTPSNELAISGKAVVIRSILGG